jgi:hypothetical protein
MTRLEFQAGEANRAQPGWYPNAYGWTRLQYWDGERWTQNYRLTGGDEQARSARSPSVKDLPDIECRVRRHTRSRRSPTANRPFWQPNRVIAVVPSEPVPLNPIGIGLVLIGAALMISGGFLPRVESHQYFRFADNTLIQSGNGWIFIALAVFIAVAIYAAIRRRRRTYAVLILAVLGIGVAIYYGTGERLDPSSLHPVGVAALGVRSTEKASPGAGLYATGAGSGLAALGGLLLAGMVSGRHTTNNGGRRGTNEVLNGAKPREPQRTLRMPEQG